MEAAAQTFLLKGSLSSRDDLGAVHPHKTQCSTGTASAVVGKEQQSLENTPCTAGTATENQSPVSV